MYYIYILAQNGLKAHSSLVCYTAVFSVVTQCEERCVTTLKTAV